VLEDYPFATIKAALISRIKQTFDIPVDFHEINLEFPPNPAFGDIGIGCFQLARKFRKSPAGIASELAAEITGLPYTKSVKAVGPYFNLEIEPSSFINTVCHSIEKKQNRYGYAEKPVAKRVMVEYSAPNTNKPQHLGHIRNNILGLSVANILSAAGYSVVKVNLINDRGIHICKSMLAYQKWGKGATPESTGKKGDHFVGDFYVLYEKKARESPYLAEEAQEMLQKWEEGDKETVTLWKTMNEWVLEGFNETYYRLGCEFDRVYLESETYKLGRDIVLKGLRDGILRKNKSGDTIIDLSEFDIGEKVLLRKDGTSIYITQDVGTTVLKFTEYKLDRSIFVVASEQNLHFDILFHVLKRLGYHWAERCYHLSYGMVYLPEGKMKSREGNVVDADILMDELHTLAREEVLKRSRDMGEEELEAVAEVVGLSALKYFMLKVHPQKDIHFIPEESLSFDGATGPYALYSYARLSSILRKGKGMLEGEADYSRLGNAEELRLALLLAYFPQVVVEAAESYNPARVAAYIFSLSKAINKFHHDHLVLNPDDTELTVARGNLIRAARQVLGNSLELFSITPLERM